VGYTGFGKAALIVNSTQLNDTLPNPPLLNIKSKAPEYYTRVLQGVWEDTSAGLIRGNVHIETNTCGVTTYYHGEIYYVESRDGGLTWYPETATYTPPLYKTCPGPNGYINTTFSSDWIITSNGPYRKTAAQAAESATRHTGTGAQWSQVVGDFVHTYYVDFWAEMPDGSHRFAVCVARSPFSSGGKPGTWTKFYNGSFSQPGINGKCSPVANMSGVATARLNVRWSNDDNTTAARLYLSVPTTFSGSMSVSDDGLNWYRIPGPFVPFLGNSLNDGSKISSSQTWFLGYNQFVQEDDNKLWMYSMNIASGRGDVRSIVRFPLDIRVRPFPGCGGRITLARYRSTNSSDVWVTWQPQEPSKYSLLAEVGYLSACDSMYLDQLVDCYSPVLKRHFIAHAKECVYSKTTPDGTPSTLVYLGSLGQSRTVSFAGLVPLYRCFNPVTKVYDAVVNENCTTGNIQWDMGYIMPLRVPGGDGTSLFDMPVDPFYDPAQPTIGPYSTEGLLVEDALDLVKASSLKEEEDSSAASKSSLSSSSFTTTFVTVGVVGGVVMVATIAVVSYVSHHYRRRRVSQLTSRDVENMNSDRSRAASPVYSGGGSVWRGDPQVHPSLLSSLTQTTPRVVWT